MWQKMLQVGSGGGEPQDPNIYVGYIENIAKSATSPQIELGFKPKKLIMFGEYTAESGSSSGKTIRMDIVYDERYTTASTHRLADNTWSNIAMNSTQYDCLINAITDTGFTMRLVSGHYSNIYIYATTY